MELNKIYHGDCLEVLKTFPDKSCDLFTDVIYNVGMDYGAYKDKLPENVYIDFISEVLIECKRVSNISIFYIPKKWNLLFWNILGPEFQEIILPFNPSGAIRYGFSNQFNKLLTNARPGTGKKPVLNVWGNMPQPGQGFFFRENTYGNPGYTSEAITYKAIKELCTNDLICDPFMGTGTTAIAALKCNKSYIGSETEMKWIEVAEKRIKEFKSQTNMEFIHL